eukprot:CAMPEP_0197076374 /NCGR_PEP_ID=MMETSP1384-20130603/212084_1 /TAXON_ID=29189 /ORGANISM="Ammonia sp." /LENGTH=559 /DNA_ID=CAMNT_0042515227 /DNA_START=28 /DNA_END=1707 /DNA_ORIENTATION=+
MATEPTPTVDSINAALAKYYQLMGAGDRYNKDGDGLFKDWCEENGMDDEQLQEEFETLQQESNDCLLLDFDDDFPLQPNQQHLQDDDRRAAIAKIMLNWENIGQQLPTLTQKDFDSVTADEMQQIINVYKTVCPAIYNQGMKVDQSLLMMLAVQYRIKFEILQYLVDSYNLYRIRGNNTNITAVQWAKQSAHLSSKQSKKIKIKLTDKTVSYPDFVGSCIGSYMHRIAPKLMFNANKIRIDDSVERIMRYLAYAASFVSNLVQTTERSTDARVALCPFHVDFCIAVGKPEESKDDDEDENDDDSDEDDNKDDSPDYTQDFVGDIQAKLEQNELRFVQLEEKEEINQRTFGNLLERLAGTNTIDKTNTKHFLHKRRLVSFIDRRKTKHQSDPKDPVFMFEPPRGPYTADVPTGNDNVPEWYVSASRSSLLPPGPDQKYDAEEAVGNKQNTSNDKVNQPGMNIGASFHAAGQVLTFSFHIPAADKVKLYLFWNGQMIRLLPEDITSVLSQIFVDNQENQKWTQDGNKEREELVEQLKRAIVDKQFEAWLQKYPVTGSNDKK